MKIILVCYIFLFFSTEVFSQDTDDNITTFTRLVTFNIRYDTPNDNLNSWKNRQWLVCKFLKKEKLDIICLQEALRHQLDDICSFLPDYAYVGKGRADGAEEGEFNPILYLKSRYEYLSDGTFWLSQYPDSIGKKGWDAFLPRIATWVKLKEKEKGTFFYIVNTHLDNKGKEARDMGMRQIKDFMCIPASEYPIIMTGDMNSSEKSNVYSIAMTRGFEMKDCYKAANKRKGVSYSFHDFGRKNIVSRTRADYVFVTNQIKVKEIDTIAEEPENGVYMSDHNPVLVLLMLNNY